MEDFLQNVSVQRDDHSCEWHYFYIFVIIITMVWTNLRCTVSLWFLKYLNKMNFSAVTSHFKHCWTNSDPVNWLYLHYSYESTKCLHSANRKYRNNNKLMCANYYVVFIGKLCNLRNKSLTLVPPSMDTYFNWKKKAVHSPLSSLISDNGCADNSNLPQVLHHLSDSLQLRSKTNIT
jgi:hypothetical protein